MKTLFRNIFLSALVASGMLVISSSVSADNRSNNRTVNVQTTNNGGRRTTKTSTNAAGGAANKNNAAVNNKNNNGTNVNKNNSGANVNKNNSGTNVGNKNNSGTNVNKNNNGGNNASNNNKNSGNISRPTTNNSGNSSANHWPSENKPNVGSNSKVSSPSDLRKGANASPNVMNDNDKNKGSNKNTVWSGNGWSINSGNKKNANHNWSKPSAPPVRNNRPKDYKINRPKRASSYRINTSNPIISGFLGILFGTSYYSSLDYLYNRGYEIDGYDNDRVYLRNVTELGFVWTDAIINYDSYGNMESAEMHYSTSYSSTSRFNKVFSTLSDTYGAPIEYSRKNGEYSAVWYGGDERGYITLEYYKMNGRYYTTIAYSYYD